MKISNEAAAVVDGSIPYEKASESVQSWLRLHIFLEACKVLDMPFESRKEAICGHPESYREELKQEIIRIHKSRCN